MQITKTLYVTDKKEWRNWLEEHYATEPEIWLIYYRKDSGKPRISYNEAVEEALCFGWIDSNVKKVDEERYAQRFSPRSPKSEYSQTNRERLRKLIEQGKVMPSVLEKLRSDTLSDEFVIPPDIVMSIKANKDTASGNQNAETFQVRDSSLSAPKHLGAFRAVHDVQV